MSSDRFCRNGEPRRRSNDAGQELISYMRSGSIRVERIPEGDAPEDVRRQLVGRIFPAIGCITVPGRLASTTVGASSGVRYEVSQEDALQVLEIENPDAARWFREHGHPQPNSSFSFAERDVREIEPVSHRV